MEKKFIMTHSKRKTHLVSCSSLPYIVICCEKNVCIFAAVPQLLNEENIYFISSFALSLSS